jgi:hypothetical protein
MHDALGHAVLDRDWLEWVGKHGGPGECGEVTHYTWIINGKLYSAPANIASQSWNELPDGTGFILFETKRHTDNCYVTDAYGEVLYRLTVPRELTGPDIPPSDEMWFRNVATHRDGKFDVSAWIEGSGSGGYA